MTTHYILADNYDRWNPGEPIEDVEAPEHYLMFLYNEYAAAIEKYGYCSPWDFANWLSDEVINGTIIKLTTDNEGRILS